MSNKHGDIKQDDYGYLMWKQPEGTSGYWSRIEEDWKTENKAPLACPSCGDLLDKWKVKYFYRWGVCNNCYYDFLEGRELKNLKSNKDRAQYCSKKMAEKKGNK